MVRRLGALLVMLGVLAGCGGDETDEPAAKTLTTVGKFGHEDEPFAEELFRDLNGFYGSNGDAHGWVRWDSALGWRVHDGASEHVNVTDGVRRSHQVDDPTLRIWFYGGSTMFGLGQRDEHTIPSEFVKLAAEDGLRVEAMNLGVMAYVNWQEVQAFAERLTTGDQADLAVFYDGANESATADQRVSLGDGEAERIARQLVSEHDIQMVEREVASDGPEPTFPEGHAIRLAAQQYLRGVDLATRLGDSYGVATAFVWQPTLGTKKMTQDDEAVAESMRMPFDTTARIGPVLAEIQRQGGDPIDLTGALDDVDRPVYLDGAHTNEYGAKVIAAALYEQLRPQLIELSE